MINAEFGLHELVIEAGAPRTPAPSPDRCPRHLFLSACAVSLGAARGELVAREIAVFITGHALTTAGKETGRRSC